MGWYPRQPVYNRFRFKMRDVVGAVPYHKVLRQQYYKAEMFNFRRVGNKNLTHSKALISCYDLLEINLILWYNYFAVFVFHTAKIKT